MARKPAVRVIGLDELLDALGDIDENIDDVEKVVAKALAGGMRKTVHIQTGHLKSTIYSKRNIAGADAPYATAEADRGGSHDFPQLAIDAFNFNKMADEIVEPF